MKFKSMRTYFMTVLLAGSLLTNSVGAEELFMEESPVAVSVTEDAQEVEASEDENIQIGEAVSEEAEEQILDMAEDFEEDLEEENWDDVLSLLAEEEVAATSGQCGDQLNWYVEQTEDTTYVRIKGTGKMWDYSPSNRPGWDNYQVDILECEGQITSIGDYAFYKQENLEVVVIGNYVESIGDYAFAECHNLWLTGWSDSLKTIGDSAYENCDIVLEQYYNDNLISIGARAFADNPGLNMITLKGTDTTIGKDAFQGCASDFIIYCEAGSKAEEYAKANGIAYAAEKVKITDCTASLSETSYVYDGKAKTPVLTVKYGDTTLEENKDFAYEYLGNTNAGTASVNIYGMGKYEGVTKVTFTIAKAESVITANDKTTLVDISKAKTLTLGAKLNRSGKLTYKSNKSQVTVDSNGKVVIAKGFSGTAQITISAAATSNYEEAKKVVNVVVNKEDNVIKASGKRFTGSAKVQTYTIKPKANGKVTFTYSSDNKNITVNKYGKVTVKKNYVGTANITIRSSATKRYNKAEKVVKVTVVKKDNTITAKNLTVSTDPAANKTVALNAKAPGGAKLSYSSDNANVTVSSNGKITIKKGYVGKATITIKAAQTKIYNEAQKKITVTVTKADNKITAADKSVYANPKQNTTIALDAKVKGGAKLTYKSDNEKVTVDAKGTVTVTKGYSGTATITISAAETNVYKAATKKVKIAVNKRANAIQATGATMTASMNSQTYKITASAKGGAALSYKSDNASVSVSNTGSVTVKGGFAGEAVITITSAATAEYKEATKKVVIKVERQKQLLTFKPTKWIKTAASVATKEERFEIIPLKYEGEISLKSKTPAYIQVFKVKDKEGKIHHMVIVKKGTPAGTYKIEVKAAATGIYAEAVRDFEITLS